MLVAQVNQPDHIVIMRFIKMAGHIDPVYFFYNDLTPEQFDQILKMAAAGNQSFD